MERVEGRGSFQRSLRLKREILLAIATAARASASIPGAVGAFYSTGHGKRLLAEHERLRSHGPRLTREVLTRELTEALARCS